jgi:hypothetical protein
VVDREVVRDPEEPRRERNRLPPEPADRLEHLEERLRRQVLGVVPVAHAEVQVAVDAIEVGEVELLQRLAIAGLRTLDQRANLRGRADSHVRRGHRFGTHSSWKFPAGPIPNYEANRR